MTPYFRARHLCLCTCCLSRGCEELVGGTPSSLAVLVGSATLLKTPRPRRAARSVYNYLIACFPSEAPPHVERLSPSPRNHHRLASSIRHSHGRSRKQAESKPKERSNCTKHTLKQLSKKWKGFYINQNCAVYIYI